MRVIWKFRLAMVADPQGLVMPRGAQIIAVGLDGEAVVVWAEVDDKAEDAMERWVQIVGTGGKPPPEGKHRATVQTAGGWVWHVYDLPGHE